MKPKKCRRLSRYLIVAFWGAVVAFIPIRISQAKSYMQQQMTRLAAEGYSGYDIYRCDYLTLSDYVGFPCITVQARRKEDIAKVYGDGYHYIEIDYPWLPFTTPEHRI